MNKYAFDKKFTTQLIQILFKDFGSSINILSDQKNYQLEQLFSFLRKESNRFGKKVKISEESDITSKSTKTLLINFGKT